MWHLLPAAVRIARSRRWTRDGWRVRSAATSRDLDAPTLHGVLARSANSQELETPLQEFRHFKKGTGHHLGVNLVILRGRDLNSSAAPPGGNLPRSARHANPQHWAAEILNERIRPYGILTCCSDRQELKSAIRDFKHLASKWSRYLLRLLMD